MISCMSAEGREIVLGLRGSGDIIGELSTLDGEARSATALAVADVDADRRLGHRAHRGPGGASRRPGS